MNNGITFDETFRGVFNPQLSAGKGSEREPKKEGEPRKALDVVAGREIKAEDAKPFPYKTICY